MVSTWCMRMEGKNSYFKKISRIGNFKNLPLSIAKRHQKLLCAQLQGTFFSFNHLECGPCKCALIGIFILSFHVNILMYRDIVYYNHCLFYCLGKQSNVLAEDGLKSDILNVLPGCDPDNRLAR